MYPDPADDLEGFSLVEQGISIESAAFDPIVRFMFGRGCTSRKCGQAALVVALQID